MIIVITGAGAPRDPFSLLTGRKAKKDQGNASRSSVDLVGFVDFRRLAEAEIDGLHFRLYERPLFDAKKGTRGREGYRKRVVELM